MIRSKELSVLLLIIINVLAQSTSYPESFSVTGLPYQNQSIYSGWIQVNDTTQSLLYYQLYSANGTDANTSTTNPLIIYLEGGPGDASSFTANFDNGPYQSSPNPTCDTPIFATRTLAWTDNYHMLYIDQPIGTGFSLSFNNDTIVSLAQSTAYLYTFLTRFFVLYPVLLEVPLYVYGRSYGGKWAPSLAFEILQNAQTNGFNLQGLIVADGIIDPIHQTTTSEYSYAAGVIDQHLDSEIVFYEKTIKDDILTLNYYNASMNLFDIQGFVPNATGGAYLNNYREYSINSTYTFPPQLADAIECGSNFMNSSAYKDAFGISQDFNFEISNVTVTLNLINDISNETISMFPYMLDQGLEILLFVGQDDMNLSPPGMMDSINSMDWDNIAQFRKSQRNIWIGSNGTVLGTYKSYENLKFVTVFKAGHLGSFDQPESIYDLINSFINGAL